MVWRRAGRYVLVVSALLWLSLASVSAGLQPRVSVEPAFAQIEDQPPRFFPETGFWVTEPFRSFWENNGGLVTFGYPVSRVFYQDGLHRQYFERAIFEHHADLAGTPYEVLLTRIGALSTHERRDERPFLSVDAASDGNCTFYPETGHRLCSGFRDYWQAHGGLPSFGYPISEEFREISETDGELHVVQYFERARLEWHPENAEPYDVLIGHLAREALLSRPVPPLALTRETSLSSPAAPLGPQPLYDDHAVACGFTMVWLGSIDDLAKNEHYLDYAAETGCEWIRIQIQWNEVELQPGRYAFNPIDLFVDAARERGLKILALVHSPTWWGHTRDSGQPADPEMFADFMGEISAHFRGRIDAWQLWNEPNLEFEAGGWIDPQGYFDLVQAAGPRVRASDPDARIVLAGLAPNSLNDPTLAVDDVEYLRELLAINGGEIFDYIDVAGIHSYGAGNSPDHYWPGNLAVAPGWTNAPEFYFRHAEELHQAFVEAGRPEMPLWLTEFGWTTRNDWPDYGYGDWVSEEQQAAYLTRAFEIARTEWPWLEAMFVFHLNIAVLDGADGPYVGFSLLDTEGEPRPAYDAIKAMPK